jgi:arabinose-5-phosphate isomerase
MFSRNVEVTDRRDSAHEIARVALREQALAVARLSDALGAEFDTAVRLIASCEGRVVVSGMGKSGLVGRKMAATFSSTGTPSYFMHPGEALHGDLGLIGPGDLVILISNSGETEELLRLLPSLRSFGNAVIAVTSAATSTLARHSNVVLHLPVEREICPNNLAPTTSTLLTMALGDALAVSLMTLRDFQPVDFARFHPGGSLGRKLLTQVRDVMHRHVPVVTPSTTVREAVDVMTKGRLGLTVVLENELLRGVFTDGDLRRAIEHDSIVLTCRVGEFMTSSPVTIVQDARLVDAETLMHARNVRALVVIDELLMVVGVLDIFDAP